MIYVTDLAAEKITHSIEQRGKGVGIRIGVKTTGCSGLSYVLEYVDRQQANDIMYFNKGVGVFVDKKVLSYVDGLTLDWQKQGLNEGFEFVNPNEKDRCGCGESFRI